MLKKQHIVVIVLFFTMNIIPVRSFSQDYKGAVGGRFGYGIGVTGLYHIQNGHVLEFLLRYGYHGLIINRPGINIQALYEKHWELGRSGAWTGYIGAGPAIGFGKLNSTAKQSYFAFGLSPIFGFDYTTQRLRLPMIFAIDYKPTFNADFPLIKKYSKKVLTNFSYYEIAFSVRFAIGNGNGRRR